MTTENNQIGFNTEYQEKKAVLKILQDELSTLLVYKEDLGSHIAKSIETEFFSKIGNLKLKCINLEIEYRRLKFMAEMMQSMINKGEEVDYEVIETAIEKELKSWHEALENLRLKYEQAVYNKFNVLSKEDAEELIQLFREIVKRIHPDINIGFDEHDLKYWNITLEAYKNSDLETLRFIYNLILNKNITKSEIVENDINAIISLTRKNIKELNSQIQKILSTYPFTLKYKIHDEQWIENHKLDLNIQIEQFNKGIENYLKHIEQLKLISEHGKLSKN
ncbi:hypothetical protein MASR1M45_18760 [Candidatus Kapaibacterium sp.]